MFVEHNSYLVLLRRTLSRVIQQSNLRYLHITVDFPTDALFFERPRTFIMNPYRINVIHNQVLERLKNNLFCSKVIHSHKESCFPRPEISSENRSGRNGAGGDKTFETS